MRKAIIVILAAFFSQFSGPTAGFAADPVELSFSIWQQPDHYMVKAIRHWAENVEQRTDGKVSFQFYYGGTLTSGTQAYDGVVQGISDVAAAATGWNAGRFPLTRITDIPLGWTSSRQASLVSWDYYKKFQPKEWDEVHLLFLYTDAIGYLHTKQPVHGIDDLKGMQVRGTGSDVPLIEAMGGTPVGMPWGEVYLSLQRGIVEGMISNYASVAAAKLAEVTDYTTEHNIRSAGFWVAMNLDKWNSLDPDVQRAIDAASEEAVAFTGQALDNAQAAGRQYVMDAGNEVITPTAAQKAEFDEALRPIADDWVKEVEAKGLPGEEVLDFVLQSMQQHQT